MYILSVSWSWIAILRSFLVIHHNFKGKCAWITVNEAFLIHRTTIEFCISSAYNALFHPHALFSHSVDINSLISRLDGRYREWNSKNNMGTTYSFLALVVIIKRICQPVEPQRRRREDYYCYSFVVWDAWKSILSSRGSSCQFCQIVHVSSWTTSYSNKLIISGKVTEIHVI